jgi:hypothetical protein
MHAAMAYINGAGARRIGKRRRSDSPDLQLLKTLLSAPGVSPAQRGKGKSKHPIHPNERRARYSKKNS